MIHAQKPILHTYSPPLLQPPKTLPPNVFVFWHRFFYIMMISYALMYHKMTTMERMMRGMVELSEEMGGLTKRLNMSTPHGRFFEGSIQFDASCMKKCWNGVSGRWGSIWFSLHKRWWGSKKYILWLSPFDVVRNRNSTCVAATRLCHLILDSLH